MLLFSPTLADANRKWFQLSLLLYSYLYGTVEEGNLVLQYNFVQKKVFFVRIIAHLFIIIVEV